MDNRNGGNMVANAFAVAQELLRVSSRIERRTRQARELYRRADVLVAEVRSLRRQFQELAATVGQESLVGETVLTDALCSVCSTRVAVHSVSELAACERARVAS